MEKDLYVMVTDETLLLVSLHSPNSIIYYSLRFTKVCTICERVLDGTGGF